MAEKSDMLSHRGIRNKSNSQMQVKLTMNSCTNVCRIVNTKLQPSLCLWSPAFQCMRLYPTTVKDLYVLETTYKFGSSSHLCSFGPIPSQWYASLHFSAGLFCPSLCPLYGKLEACFILCQIESNRSLYVLVQSSLVALPGLTKNKSQAAVFAEPWPLGLSAGGNNTFFMYSCATRVVSSKMVNLSEEHSS